MPSDTSSQVPEPSVPEPPVPEPSDPLPPEPRTAGAAVTPDGHPAADHDAVPPMPSATVLLLIVGAILLALGLLLGLGTYSLTRSPMGIGIAAVLGGPGLVVLVIALVLHALEKRRTSPPVA